MRRHSFKHQSEVTRGNHNFKTNMAASLGEKPSEFWHRNLVEIPKFTNAFIEKFASENLPIKATLTRGYKFFYESYIHDVEGKLQLVSRCVIYLQIFMIWLKCFGNSSLKRVAFNTFVCS